MSIRITCINKAGGYHEDPHEAISHLSWIEDGTGLASKWTRIEMYDWIHDKGGDAYVQAGTARAKLETRISSRGTRYVRTKPDHTTSDNLLRLPECA
jgi:hypothetical protein